MTFKKLLILLRKHQDTIILATAIILISLFSFAVGFIVARQENREPLMFEVIDNY